jgi:hypothetical protein
LNYDHFITRPTEINKDLNSNCLKEENLVYKSGRFSKNFQNDSCMKWEGPNVTSIPLFTVKAVQTPAFNEFEHIPPVPESGWSYMQSHLEAIEEASLIHTGGGVTNTSLADLLALPAGALSSIIHALYGISGFASVFVFIILAVIVLNIVRSLLAK